ncbi:DMBT1-like protein [Mya arenaria]|uniref:DMBT1-like protein n=1 Tax=Mya arenaria TaxID=6604 RepID=A0ABY7DRA7_MYAAR|nr:DMBT1-like protein [Mya arenaria]
MELEHMFDACLHGTFCSPRLEIILRPFHLRCIVNLERYGKIYEGVPASGGNVVIEDLQCRGIESNVKQCTSKVWLSNTCGHSQDVSIDCYCNDSGRLEVFYSGQWGTVCNIGFDIRDAETVCRILRHYGGIKALPNLIKFGKEYIYSEIKVFVCPKRVRETSPTYYRSYSIEGRGYGAIMIENLQCRGREWSLAQCDSGPWLSNTNCSHYDDVGVDCSASLPYCGGYFNGWSGYIASPNYPNPYFNGQHCEYHLSVPSGHVRDFNICPGNKLEQYGDLLHRTYNDCSIYYGRLCHNDRYQVRRGMPFYLHNTVLSPPGIRLVNGHSPYSCRVEVYHNGQWGMVCDDSIRLVNGPNYHSGRVEVYHNGRWGTVCDNNFDHRDVMVICRMLGYFQGEQYGRPYQGAHFGRGSGTIWLSNLGCNGYESDVRNCYHQGWGSHGCSSLEDAGVECYGIVFIVNEYI